MRGEPCGHDGHQAGERITPAYAGRTASRPRETCARGDHPRVCGENRRPSGSVRQMSGSPPRMRGERTLLWALLGALRITPAYAGRTIRLNQVSLRQTDHPRVCGENLRRPRTRSTPLGSPPRMRGERIKNIRKPPFSGITPAYAGRTVVDAGYRGLQQDHPRVCGENFGVDGRLPWLRGSPPRMRGERCGCSGGRGCRGITPAYAGRTLNRTQRMFDPQDHPRVCGENLSGSTRRECSIGSPPRMRGERRLHGDLLSAVGITPAYAGRTVVGALVVVGVGGITPAYAGRTCRS
ncbi:Hypothetical protein PFR_JS9-2_2011 [Propionibacterium freudenreichii]|nr:Hypothetical protein PFR_JS9-1_2013 [Propionibacterium freudenreichii]SCQ70561.1 Hypothetical protein PFR_JS9-2_2011 [Propionibacterium freudenreichii]